MVRATVRNARVGSFVAALFWFAAEVASAAPPTLVPIAFDGVGTDVGSDGAVWARAPRWKLRVAEDGASFIPALGERAPANRPIDFAAPAISVGGAPVVCRSSRPVVAGSRISVDRGAVVERYELSIAGVEQSFVIDALPARGEIVLRVPVATGLACRATDAGLEFDVPEFGAVRYGDATIKDARGRSIAAKSRIVDAAVEIRVPEAWVASAALPIVIDPMISPTFTIDASGPSVTHPDVAYDATNDVYLVVYQVATSASDHDILGHRFTSTGTKLDTLFFDVTSEDTTEPGCANNAGANQFLTVWRKDKSGLFDDIEIRGRTVAANGTTSSQGFTISTGSDNESHPVVGGASTAAYLVAWQENPVLGVDGENISARTVTTSGSLNAKVSLASTIHDETNPSVSKFARAGSNWLITWEVQPSATSEHDIRAAAAGPTLGFFDIDVALESDSTVDDFDPIVTETDVNTFVVLWTRNNSTGLGSTDVVGARFTASVGSPIVMDSAFSDVSDIQAFLFDITPQDVRAIATDGDRISCLYVESSTDMRLTSMFFDEAKPSLIEKGIDVLTGQPNGRAAICAASASGGPVGQSLIAIEETGDSTTDLVGVFFASITDGGTTTVQTGCGGGLEPQLSASASAIVCGGYTLTLTGFHTTPLLTIGTPATVPLCPGQGGCVLGNTADMVIPTHNGNFPFTLPCDGSLVDVKIAVTGVDQSVSGTASDSCGPPVAAKRFRTSDTIVIDFQ